MGFSSVSRSSRVSRVSRVRRGGKVSRVSYSTGRKISRIGRVVPSSTSSMQVAWYLCLCGQHESRESSVVPMFVRATLEQRAGAERRE
jgi:hypothetical protein